MGGFSQSSAISDEFLSTNRLKTTCLTSGSNSRYEAPAIAERTAQRLTPRNI